MSKDIKTKTIIDSIQDNEQSGDSKFTLFGKNISEMPCVRSTFIYAILGGIGCGLLTFLATSRVKLSTDVAVYSFAGIGLSYWVTCGLNYTKKRVETREKMKTWDMYGGPIDESKWDEYTKKANS